MAAPLSDECIELPQALIVNSPGLAFDIGGSLAKIVYRSNKEYNDGQPIIDKVKGENGHLHLAIFLRAEIDNITKFMSENSDLKKDENGEILVNATGVGAYQFKDIIQEAVGIKLNILTEMDCFMDTFKKLIDIIPEEEMLYPTSAKVAPMIQKIQSLIENAGDSWKKTTEMEVTFDLENVKPKEAETGGAGAEGSKKTSPLPALFAMCGSGTGFMLMTEDGKFQFLEGASFAGRSFLALANQLIGEKDYDKLMEMVESTDGKTVDVFGADLKADVEDDCLYSQMVDDSLVYSFGKGLTSERSEIKDEDLVFSLLKVICNEHATTAFLIANLHKVKHVYFCGNFVRSTTCRDVLELLVLLKKMMSHDGPTFKFLKNGGFYGAIGCYIYDKKELTTRL